MSSALKDKIEKDFISRFQQNPTLFIAPARINIIGEHVDYNDGFVIPAAIDKYFVFAVRESGNDKCNIFADDFNEGVTFSIHELNPGEAWVNYLMGMIDAFQRKGILNGGIDCVFGGNIPAGAGMSSSAALCCGFGFALNHLFDSRLDRLTIAVMAQYSEHEFASVNCGIMDQYACLFGEENSVIHLDCRKLTHEIIKFHPPDHSILLVDTKIKHSLGTSAYNNRREACEIGLGIVRKKYQEVFSLRDAARVMLYEQRDVLGEEIFIKCLFIVEEIARARKAADNIKQKDFAALGDLMYEAHWGLSQAYEVSCEELDFLVMLAEEDKFAVIGSRMMGGGFGGCTINLIKRDQEEIFKEKVRQKYFATFKQEPDFYPVQLSKGVHQLKA